LDVCLDKGALGLVSQFSVCKNFREKSKPEHKPQTFGYLLFDGDSIDCEGEFVPMEEDGNVSTERVRFLKMWEKQLQEMKETKQGHKTHMKEAITMSPRNDNAFEDDVAVEENNSSGASMAESESSSSLGVLDVVKATRKFGSLRGYWEGSYSGERAIQQVKPALRGVHRRNMKWDFLTLRKIHQNVVLQRLLCDAGIKDSTTRSRHNLVNVSVSKELLLDAVANNRPLSAVQTDGKILACIPGFVGGTNEYHQ
jgi:hypothetical protein